MHALLAGGLKALAGLFPGFEDDLVRAGAVPLRAGLDIRLERPGFDPFPVRDLGLLTYAVSRPAIEFAVRLRTTEQGKVQLQPQCRVIGIVSSADGAAAVGVRWEDAYGAAHMLPTDLVIDASGRAVPTLAFLQSTGRAAPGETSIGVDIGYASATYEIPEHAPSDWKGVMTFPIAPQSSRGALMLPLEGRRWMVSLGGRGADKPPSDDTGFLDCVRQLRTPTIYNAIRDAKRIGNVARYAFPQSVRRHFEHVRAFPRGLLPIGDAVCRFNPVYGQGMSVAAQEAVALRDLLTRLARRSDPLAKLAPAFFAELQSLLEAPWALAAIPDFVFPETIGRRPPDLKRHLKFAAALMRLAAREPAVHKLTVEVQHLLKPRSVYRRPLLMARVLMEMMRD
ncbi:hypothetical protein OOT46_01945 [Aquabacterium sp. A7-Y]|nr:hypothetical protein [Aquabacterium sp. A7-Y]MCW7536618.1 hypothetical protein [Aquabacterium sp. A7-Y]